MADDPYDFPIKGMICTSCAAHVTPVIETVGEVTANLASEGAIVCAISGAIDANRLVVPAATFRWRA